MASFIGDYGCKSDSKGRVVVPVSFRKELAAAGESHVVLRKDIFERCIVCYPKGAWLQETAGLQASLSSFNRRQATFLREFFRGTLEVEPDGAGRILIPRRMLEQIEATDELVMVGQGNRIEIWAKIHYDASALSPEELEQLTGELFNPEKD